jgi:uncharacterized protein YjbI with pentapeptide repeats
VSVLLVFYSSAALNKENLTNLKLMDENDKLQKKLKNAVFLTLFVGLTAIDQPQTNAQSIAASTDLRRWLDTKECVGCNLSGVDLEKANLTGANTSGANFQGTKLENVVGLTK